MMRSEFIKDCVRRFYLPKWRHAKRTTLFEECERLAWLLCSLTALIVGEIKSVVGEWSAVWKTAQNWSNK